MAIRKKSTAATAAKKAMIKKRSVKKSIDPADYLSTGSTLLNLACSGTPNGGFAIGHYYLIVGDSMSGKTFLSLTCLAEASVNSRFKDYRFIFDDAEGGALMDIGKFFGMVVEQKLEPPANDKNGPIYSTTAEQFYFHIDDALKIGKPFIYVLDSMDALDTEEDEQKFQQRKRKARGSQTKSDEKKSIGSYGTSKAKLNSSNLRRLLSRLKASGSILIIISQTRDNLDISFERKTRAGGRALRFYTTLEIWSSIVGKIYKTVKGKKRQIGVNCQLHVRKNRVRGYDRKVTVPIYHTFGIDDIGSCVDYLIEEDHWDTLLEKVKIIDAKDFGVQYVRDKLIEYIEENGLEDKLQSIVAEVWNEIEEQSAVKRKTRY